MTANSPRLSLGVLCGGRSGEHEVSLQSAYGIYGALDRLRYTPLLVAIDKDGKWRVGDSDSLLLNPGDPERISINPAAPVVIPHGEDGRCCCVSVETMQTVAELDAVLPIIHGTDGEDGALQGLLQMMGVPYVGADVLGSAVGMDKDVMKRLLTLADVPVAPCEVLHGLVAARGRYEEIAARLGGVLFVKPAALGSSVGVNRVADAAAYEAAVAEAFGYGEKVIVEQFVAGRELECSVLGSRYSRRWPPAASPVGEIRPRHDFYSYRAKYLDAAGAELLIPAPLDPETEQRVRAWALRAFDVLECEGMARVDFFLREGGGLVVNEINTLPGFTPISMYPKLWEAGGLPYTELLTALVELALERQRRRRAHQRNFVPAANAN